jgi:hypothetical protein
MNLARCMCRIGGFLVLGLMSAGCAGSSPSAVGTGAARVAQDFCEGVLRQDWAQAYGALDEQSQARCRVQQFNLLAGEYRKIIGFEPREVFVRSCEEHGDQALAHVVFTGSTSTDQKFYKDVVPLRRSAAGWGVLLPARLGRNLLH